jgi:hypothetical protein
MGAHPSGETMVDGPDFEIDGFNGTEGPFDLGKAFIGGDKERTFIVSGKRSLTAAVSSVSAGTLVLNT